MSEKPAAYRRGNVLHVAFLGAPLMIDGERMPYGDLPERANPRKVPMPIKLEDRRGRAGRDG